MNLQPVSDEAEAPSTGGPVPAASSDDLPWREPGRVPVDVRSLSLAVLAVLATVFMLRWASEVFIPLMMGILCSYALSPVVDRLERLRRLASLRADAEAARNRAEAVARCAALRLHRYPI